MTINSFSQPLSATNRSHRRLDVVIAKVLGDVFIRSRFGIGLSIASLLLIPGLFAFVTAVQPGSSLSPAIADTLLRNLVPVFLGIALLCISGLLASVTMMGDPISRTHEPLLTSGVKRWEIAAGQFLAALGIWSWLTAIQLAALAVVAQWSWFQHNFPIVSYFHPTTAFLGLLGLVYLSCGAMIFGIAGTFGANSDGRPLRIAIPMFLAMLIGSSRCWPLEPFVPYANLIRGVVKVFALLPPDGRVDPATFTEAGSHDAVFVGLVITVAAAYTILSLAVAVRRLNGGMDYYMHRAR